MVRRKRSASGTSLGIGEILAALRLRDVQVKSISSLRHFRADDARNGRLRTSYEGTVEFLRPKNSDANPLAIAEVKLTVVGLPKTAAEGADDVQSFDIEIRAEGFFSVESEADLKAFQSSEDVTEYMLQSVFPILTQSAAQIIRMMGYPVKLGFSLPRPAKVEVRKRVATKGKA